MSGYDPGSGGWGPPPGSGAPGWGPPPAPGAPGWGPPSGWGPYYPAQTDGKAIGALVAAILSWVVCPVLPAVVALVLAAQSTSDIAASQGRLAGDGFNTAARITAWINIVVYGVGGVILLLIFMAAGA